MERNVGHQHQATSGVDSPKAMMPAWPLPTQLNLFFSLMFPQTQKSHTAVLLATTGPKKKKNGASEWLSEEISSSMNLIAVHQQPIFWRQNYYSIVQSRMR